MRFTTIDDGAFDPVTLNVLHTASVRLCAWADLFAQRLAYLLGRVAVLVDQAGEFVLADAELAGPEAHLVVLREVDAGAVLRATIGPVVCHRILLPDGGTRVNSKCSQQVLAVLRPMCEFDPNRPAVVTATKAHDRHYDDEPDCEWSVR